ncbi:conserved hypothetical protein [Ricinus communis]|uniref:Uncharacterized protein n=1 Tax=Ricinus communis TaxID=3988 RepID=B9S2T5_RICCO|nr:conserved hypothetical protein [Ricinus communis]
MPCIVKWHKNSHLCPSCRFAMPACGVVDGTFRITLCRNRSRSAIAKWVVVKEVKELECLLGRDRIVLLNALLNGESICYAGL